jgi:nitrogen-specific signal transduction histidine kinase
MTSKPQEGAHIKFSTQIIKRLGEELNPSVDQSILELVKNAYDADATECTVALSNIMEEGGTIVIQDNGDGMDAAAIRDGYLVLGESKKSFDKRTRLERIPAGSKGLGRLAALRMGNVVELNSVAVNDKKKKFSLVIDWVKFDRSRLVEDVTFEIKQEVAKPHEGGTRIAIKNLKQKIGERDIKKIARGLILLSDPFDDDPSAFRPKLKSAEFKEMEQLVAKRYFDDAEYHLRASVSKSGMAEASILDFKGNVLFKASHKEIAVKRKGDQYLCPAVSFELWVFLLTNTSFNNRPTSVGEVKDWLSEFGGVHVYENGLRVNPYGNQGNDWLDMNLARVRNPEERPSTNTSIGVVRIADSQNMLVQKTDRSGFIENDTFHQIKAFCHDALEWMAKTRLAVAEKKRRSRRHETASKSDVTKENVREQIQKLKGPTKAKVEKAFSSYDKAREDEIKSLRMEVQLYRTLSTAGITTATFSHESVGNPLKVLEQATRAIERRSKVHLGDNFDLITKPIAMIKQAVKSLAVLSKVTLQLLSNEKRRRSKVEIHGVIENIINTLEPFLTARDISVSTEFGAGNPFLNASEAAIESVITNLFNNSVVAIENAGPATRSIHIATEVLEDLAIIRVNDNGSGIKGIALKDIWLPGQTTSPNGTGLGLVIVKDTVSDLGGSVRANKNGPLGGAEFIIELPIIGK